MTTTDPGQVQPTATIHVRAIDGIIEKLQALKAAYGDELVAVRIGGAIVGSTYTVVTVAHAQGRPEYVVGRTYDVPAGGNSDV